MASFIDVQQMHSEEKITFFMYGTVYRLYGKAMLILRNTSLFVVSGKCCNGERFGWENRKINNY